MTHHGSRKLEVNEHDGSAATAQTVWSTEASKRFALTHLAVSVENAGKCIVYDGTNIAGRRLVNQYFQAAGGIVREFSPDTGRVAVQPGSALKVIHVGGGIVTVLAEGFTRED